LTITQFVQEISLRSLHLAGVLEVRLLNDDKTRSQAVARIVDSTASQKII